MREDAVVNVLMLVANPCVHDSRVLKEAASLRAAGYAITIVCDSDHGRVPSAIVDDVAFRRVDLSLRAWLGWTGRQGRIAGKDRANGHANPWRAVRSQLRALGLRLANTAVGRIAVTALRHRAIRVAVERTAGTLRPDIVHAHDLETLSAGAAIAAARRVCLVYDAHELEKHRVAVGPWERRRIDRIERALIRRASAVITVGNAVARELARDYALVPPPVVVMNAPDLQRQRPCKASIRVAAGVAADAPLGIYIGRLNAQRGVEEVLHGLVHCPGFHLACAGFGEASVIDALQALAARLGVLDRFHLAPAVPPDELIAYIASADFAVIPTQAHCLNYRYSMPNKLFEATFAGLPVCASDLPEQRGFVIEAGNGVLMMPDDPADIARAMQVVYAERARFRPTAAALALLAEKYAWTAQSARLLDLYATLSAPDVMHAARD